MSGAEYFTTDENFVYLAAPYAEFYIPYEFFKNTSKFAEDCGDTIKAIGLFDVGIFNNGKLSQMKIFNVPTWIDLYSYNNEVRDILLPHSETEIPCRVLSYNKGDKIMNVNIIEDGDNASAYLGLVCAGKVPNSVPYGKSAQIWHKNQELNSVHLGVPAVIEELILSVSYRQKDDPTQKFAKAIGQNDSQLSEYDYRMVNIRQICQFASTFSALWFEDFDSMTISSLNRTKMHKTEADSPLEKIIKM